MPRYSISNSTEWGLAFLGIKVKSIDFRAKNNQAAISKLKKYLKPNQKIVTGFPENTILSLCRETPTSKGSDVCEVKFVASIVDS